MNTSVHADNAHPENANDYGLFVSLAQVQGNAYGNKDQK